MAIEKLSPDEINGLLGQGTEEKTMFKNNLLQIEKEALTELLAVSLGGSSPVLSELLSEQVKVSSPAISIKRNDDLLSETSVPFFVVLGEYTGGVNGIQILSVSKSDVQALAQMMGAETETEDMEKQFQVLQELVTAMFSSVTQSMGTILEKEVSHTLSGMDAVSKHKDFPVSKFTEEEWFVESQFQLNIGTLKKSEFPSLHSGSIGKAISGSVNR